MDLEKIAGDNYLISLPGELISDDDAVLLEIRNLRRTEEKNSIVLDFSNVGKINGLGASMLVKMYNLTLQQKRQLFAFGVNEHYSDVLYMTGLSKVMQIFPTREEAYADAGISDVESTSAGVSDVVSQDIDCWAKPIARLQLPEVPREAWKLNVKGRRVVGPVDGFGQLWQKRYRLNIKNLDTNPENIIEILKQNFPRFQPGYNRFYPSPAGIKPGEIVLIDSSTPGGPVSTGVLVLYADDLSFTFITPQGHPESGWVTFSAFRTADNITVQILGLARANDPVYEAAFRVIGSKMQVRIWQYLLTALAGHLGVPADIMVEPQCVAGNIQWSQMGNLWYNAQIRTLLYSPVRLVKR